MGLRNLVKFPELRHDQFRLTMEIVGDRFETLIYTNQEYERVYKRVVYPRTGRGAPVTCFVVGKLRNKTLAHEFRTLRAVEAHLAVSGARKRA